MDKLRPPSGHNYTPIPESDPDTYAGENTASTNTGSLQRFGNQVSLLLGGRSSNASTSTKDVESRKESLASTVEQIRYETGFGKDPGFGELDFAKNISKHDPSFGNGALLSKMPEVSFFGNSPRQDREKPSRALLRDLRSLLSPSNTQRAPLTSASFQGKEATSQAPRTGKASNIEGADERTPLLASPAASKKSFINRSTDI